MDEQTAHAPRSSGLVSMDSWTASFDALYRKTDRLYYVISSECGLSEAAYWVMYDLYMAGASVPVQGLISSYCSSKQTISSAIRQLEAKGFAQTTFCEGSRKAKAVCLTEEGLEFAELRIKPASEAERRAFSTLDDAEQAEMLRLVNKYVQAVEVELDRLSGRGSDGEK